ncbi:MAG TPA: hypothetical protein VFQ61_16365 [Polyangiaceae bacterium]|nr:hypothetical protein [Polyangiaceae bacterium]
MTSQDRVERDVREDISDPAVHPQLSQDEEASDSKLVSRRELSDAAAREPLEAAGPDSNAAWIVSEGDIVAAPDAESVSEPNRNRGLHPRLPMPSANSLNAMLMEPDGWEDHVEMPVRILSPQGSPGAVSASSVSPVLESTVLDSHALAPHPVASLMTSADANNESSPSPKSTPESAAPPADVPVATPPLSSALPSSALPDSTVSSSTLSTSTVPASTVPASTVPSSTRSPSLGTSKLDSGARVGEARGLESKASVVSSAPVGLSELKTPAQPFAATKLKGADERSESREAPRPSEPPRPNERGSAERGNSARSVVPAKRATPIKPLTLVAPKPEANAASAAAQVPAAASPASAASSVEAGVTTPVASEPVAAEPSSTKPSLVAAAVAELAGAGTGSPSANAAEGTVPDASAGPPPNVGLPVPPPPPPVIPAATRPNPSSGLSAALAAQLERVDQLLSAAERPAASSSAVASVPQAVAKPTAASEPAASETLRDEPDETTAEPEAALPKTNTPWGASKSGASNIVVPPGTGLAEAKLSASGAHGMNGSNGVNGSHGMNGSIGSTGSMGTPSTHGDYPPNSIVSALLGTPPPPGEVVSAAPVAGRSWHSYQPEASVWNKHSKLLIGVGAVVMAFIIGRATAPSSAVPTVTKHAAVSEPAGEAKPPAQPASASPPSAASAAASPAAPAAASAAPAPSNAAPDGAEGKAVAAPAKPEGEAGAFDEGAASEALKATMEHAASCKHPGDPSGQLQVSITFAPAGKVTAANLGGIRFARASARNCVGKLLKDVRVPAFTGPAVTLKKSFKF